MLPAAALARHAARLAPPNPPRQPHPSPGGSGAALEDVIAAVGAVNKQTVVCAAVPGQILTDWRNASAAILVACVRHWPARLPRHALASSSVRPPACPFATRNSGVH